MTPLTIHRDRQPFGTGILDPVRIEFSEGFNPREWEPAALEAPAEDDRIGPDPRRVGAAVVDPA